MTSKPVIILGAGGHAKVIAESLRLSNREILGFVTPELEAGTVYCGATVLGDDTIIYDYTIDEIELANGIGSLPENYHRWKLARLMRDKYYSFTTVIHPNAIVASDVILGEGAQVMAGVVIQSGATVGRDTIINTGAIVDHDCVIAENCHLAPGVVCSGGVSVGRNTHIGTGVKVIQGINIGERSVIGAGSTIYKNVPAGMLVKQTFSTVMNVVRA